MYAVDEDGCTGCGLCLEYCPTEAIAMRGGVAEIDRDFCNSCGACSGACPQNAIYEHGELPAPYLGDRSEVAGNAAPERRVAMARRPAVLTGREKAAAAAILLPALSRVLARLAGRPALRGGNGSRSRDGGMQDGRATAGGDTGRNRRRRRGGRMST